MHFSRSVCIPHVPETGQSLPQTSPSLGPYDGAAAEPGARMEKLVHRRTPPGCRTPAPLTAVWGCKLLELSTDARCPQMTEISTMRIRFEVDNDEPATSKARLEPAAGNVDKVLLTSEMLLGPNKVTVPTVK